MEPNYKIETSVDKIADNKQESFWYEGDIAHIGLLSGTKIYAEATGEIGVSFTTDQNEKGEFDVDVYKGKEASERANEFGYDDEDIQDTNKVHWRNNSWFAIIEVDINGNYIDDLAIVHTYDEAIESLLECAKKVHNEEYKTI
jgi:hypothetical protein